MKINEKKIEKKIKKIKKEKIEKYLKGTKNPISLIKTARYRKKNKRAIFPYYGIEAYMGEFGGGKTISAVKEALEILKKYPKATFITNTSIAGVCNETHTYTNADELIECLMKYITEENQEGYVIFIDEIHVVLKDLFGKSEDNDFMTFLSQLRKFGIYIIGTAQIYSRCPKTVREYLRLNGQIILCKKLIAGTTLLCYVDMTTVDEDAKNNLKCKISKWKFYFHTVELYQSYDTFAIISQIKNLIKKEDK